MKYRDQQPGLFRIRNGWRFYEGALDRIPEDRHERVHGLFGKGCVACGPTSIGFDDSEWETVSIPHDSVVRHDFTEKSESGCFHGGKKRLPVWYRRHFHLDEADRDLQLLLEFEGVSRDASVFVNGTYLGRSRSGYHPFTVDITDIARFGEEENVLAVEIDPQDGEGWWYEGCGIYRPVWLIKKPLLHFAEDGIFVRPVCTEDGWITDVTTEVTNLSEEEHAVEVRFYLLDEEGMEIADSKRRAVLLPAETRKLNTSFAPAQVRLWEPDHPNRYRLVAELHASGTIRDYRKVWYGYRSLRFDAEKGFFLNDVPTKLKGFCIHQDHTGIGVAVPYTVKEYRLRQLKEIGANAIRTAHHTDPDIQEIADRIGLMVMEESRAFRTSEETLAHIRDMARKARNHPSVILYSLFNEEPLQGTPQGARLVRHMRRVIEAEDDSRPFTGAMNGGFLNADGAAKELDVIGINYNTGDYDTVHAMYPDRPIVGTETVSSFMVRGEYATDEERHVVADTDSSCAPWGNTVRDGWRQVQERPFIAGTFAWTGLDYRGEPTPYRWPTIASLFGALDACGFRKNAAWLYKAFWTKEPFVHVLPDMDQPFDMGQEVCFQVYTNCPEAELFLNGKSLGRKVVDPYEMACWQAPYELGTLRAVGLNGETVLCEDISRTPGVMTGIRIALSKNTMAADGEDAVVVNAEAVDAMGHFVPSADTLIFFETEGGAEVIGTGSGDPNSHEPDGLYYRRMFHGRCQAIIRNTDGADVTVRAYAEEMQGDEDFITVYEADAAPDLL